MSEVRDAWFSPCRTYRYGLSRIWDDGKPRAVFIGLNPSTADEAADDNTVRRCRGFAKANDYGGLVMMNLFAFRATDPRTMRAAPDPVGPENDAWLRRMAAEAHDTEIGPMSEGEPGERNLLVAAWGVGGGFRGRDRAVYGIVRETANLLHCLGMTKGGYPRHPLYVRSDMDFCIYEVNEAR